MGKEKMKKWPFALGFVLLILLVAGMFFYFSTTAPSSPPARSEIINPIANLSREQAISQFNEQYIDYLVFAIGGWKLHNPPLSEETPKIKVVVEGEIFISEIANGKIKTEKKDIDNEDIIIQTTKGEIVDSILSLDMKNYIKQSVQDGRTTLQLKASYTTLFSKGYPNIYKDITGKSFTGSAVRIFERG